MQTFYFFSLDAIGTLLFFLVTNRCNNFFQLKHAIYTNFPFV